MNTTIHGGQRGEWPEPNRNANVPVERTDRARSGQEDPRDLTPQAFAAAQLATSAAARARQSVDASPTVDAAAVTASIVAAEAAAKARIAAAVKPRADNGPAA